jgi:hypothetical protein
MLAELRFVSISDWKMQKKVPKQTMKISYMCTFNKPLLLLCVVGLAMHGPIPDFGPAT